MIVTETPRLEVVKTAGKAQPTLCRLLEALFWVAALTAGAWQAWHFRNTISTDGISYLDMGSEIARGNWHAVINGYWSPLYPALIGLALRLGPADPLAAFAVVHAVNFAIFVGALGSFAFFLRRLMGVSSVRASLPDWFLVIAGYSLFIWTSLALITNSGASPDMTLALFVFLVAGLLIEIASVGATARTYAVLGCVLAVGFLAKAPLFPLSFAAIGLTLFAPASLPVKLRRAALALTAFAVVSAPYVWLLSSAKHRLTFGDSGKLNYAWYVDGATYRHWQGAPLGPHSEVAPQWTRGPVSTGVPAHPTRKVLESPPVYAFGEPVAGTYPAWYDPSYWDEGLSPVFDLKQQLRKIVVNVRFMYSLLLNVHVIQLYRENQLYKLFSPLAAVLFAVLFWTARGRLTSFRSAAWMPLAFSVAALAMYSLVYCEPRHLAPFVVLLFLGSFSIVRWTHGSSALVKVAAAGLGLGLLLSVTAQFVQTPGPKPDDFQVAQLLLERGLGQGSRVASVEYSNHANVKWARLVGARIVAEVYTDAFAPRGYFWTLDEQSQARALRALRESGAEVVVASDLPKGAIAPSGWERIGNTKYFLRRLS